MLAGAAVAYVAVGPALVRSGLAHDTSFQSLVPLLVWPSAALLVSAGIVSFALERAPARRAAEDSRGAAEDAPDSQNAKAPAPRARLTGPLARGAVALSLMVVALEHFLFELPWTVCLLTIPLALGSAIVAARSMGETDVVPTRALAPLSQLAQALAAPGHLAANVLGANPPASVALHAADTLTTAKAARLLGVRLRVIVPAQLLGIAVGSLAVAFVYLALVPDARALPSDALPAPAVLVWKSVSEALVAGLAGLPAPARTGAWVAAGAGVVLALVERFAPPRVRKWVPSAMGIGGAMVVPFSTSATIFVGAMVASVLRRSSKLHIVPVAAGLVAGESLVGIVLEALRAAGSR
jgi:uncharacterized oligopeptide transporter (OPT) family protein